jgi:PAS domain S-box-containing protein
MKKITRPIPLNEEIKLDPTRTIMSKTDKKGIIEYANDYFMEISGYKEWELMGQPHNVIRHPDMPKAVFKILWDRINNGIPTYALVKNLAKDGRYYWVIAHFLPVSKNGEIVNHYAKRKAVPDEVKGEISDLYQILLELEKSGGMEAAEAYLHSYLEDNGMSYDDFIFDIMRLSPKELKQYIDAQISDESLGLGMTAEEAIKKSVKKKRRFFW